MMYSIQNEWLKATINPKGAELTNLILLQDNLDVMWSGNAAYWGKVSPVLFPIVGGLKDNTYSFEGQSYQLGRHGFARDRVFEVVAQTDDSIVFELQNNESTWAVYPFAFVFQLRYSLAETALKVEYWVENPSDETLYFSVGGHPAFKVPLEEGTAYNDYELFFNADESFARWPLSAEGLIETTPVPIRAGQSLPLTKELFCEDALVFKGLASNRVCLRSSKTRYQLTFDFPDFPFLGIWAAKNADFVCIEPWCGIADAVTHNQELKQKEGIISLGAKQTFSRAWTVGVGV